MMQTLVWGLGLRVQGSGLRIQGLGFGLKVIGFMYFFGGDGVRVSG